MVGVVFKGQHCPGHAEVNYLRLDAFSLAPSPGKEAAASGWRAGLMCLHTSFWVTAGREKQN